MSNIKSSTEPYSRIFQLDLLRSLAIIGVILIHITAPSHSFYSVILNQTTRFAVPFFLIISGILLGLSNSNVSFFNFFTKKMAKLLPLYLIWSTVYYLLSSKDCSIVPLIKGILFGYGAIPLYFVPLIFQFYLLYYFIFRKFNSLQIVIFSLLIQIASFIVYQHFHDIHLINKYLGYRYCLTWFAYMPIGIYISGKLDYLKKYWKLFSIAAISLLILMIFENWYYIHYGINLKSVVTSLKQNILIYSLAMFGFVWNFSINNKYIEYVSKASYSIYLSHVLFLRFFQNAFDASLNHSSLPYIILALVFVMSCSLLFYEISERFIKLIKLLIEKYYTKQKNLEDVISNQPTNSLIQS